MIKHPLAVAITVALIGLALALLFILPFSLLDRSEEDCDRLGGVLVSGHCIDKDVVLR